MKGRTGRLRRLAVALVLGATLLLGSTWAEQHPQTPRIDVLIPQDEVVRVRQGLRDALSELGYIEGRSIAIDWRTHGQTKEDVARLANALGQSKADLIVAITTPAALTALSATNKPVVFIVGDPVGAGLAASLAHPGGNATGVSTLVAELVGKRLELLHLLVPGMRRVALLRNPNNPLDVSSLDNAQQAARESNVRLVTLEARNAKDLDRILHALKRGTADGMVVSADSLFRTNQPKIARTANDVGLPAIFPFYLGSDNGALMSYGPSIKEATQRAAELRRQDSQRRQTVRAADRTDVEVRVGYRPASGAGDGHPNLRGSLAARRDEVIR